jgi:hypothetical protein
MPRYNATQSKLLSGGGLDLNFVTFTSAVVVWPNSAWLKRSATQIHLVRGLVHKVDWHWHFDRHH